MIGRVPWDVTLGALLLAFAAAMVIATLYSATYQGVGYLRGFVQTLELSSLVATIVMLAIGDDVARGLGMIGALTLIRFRATLKDTRDLIFVFASLGVGVACGVQAFSVAIIGTIAFAAAVIFLRISRFGTRQRFDTVLRFRASSEPEIGEQIRRVLERHCHDVSLIDVRSGGEASQEFAYHLTLAKPGLEATLVHELEQVTSVTETAMFKQDATLEM